MELHIPFEKHIAETGVLWRVVTSTALSATLLLGSVLSNILLIHREDRRMVLPWLVVNFSDSICSRSQCVLVWLPQNTWGLSSS